MRNCWNIYSWLGLKGGLCYMGVPWLNFDQLQGTIKAVRLKKKFGTTWYFMSFWHIVFSLQRNRLQVCLDVAEQMFLRFVTWHGPTYVTVFHQQPWRPLARWGHLVFMMLIRNVICIDGCIPFMVWISPPTKWQWTWMLPVSKQMFSVLLLEWIFVLFSVGLFCVYSCFGFCSVEFFCELGLV